MKEEYISRKDAVMALISEMAGTGYQTYALDAIRFCENKDVEPVKHGHWIHKINYEGQKHTVCSQCGYDRYGHFSFEYCMDCGAKMDEDIKCETNKDKTYQSYRVSMPVKYLNRHGEGPDLSNKDLYNCPRCGRRLRNKQHDKFCGNCGQAIDWDYKEEEE